MSDKKPGDAPASPPPKDTPPANPPPADGNKGAAGDPPPANPPPVVPPKPPEKYELKMRDKGPLHKTDLDEIEAAAKAQGLSQEAAQRLVEGQEATYDKFSQRQQTAYREHMESLRKAAESDHEIAGKDGKDFTKNVELSHRAVKELAGKDHAEVQKFLNETGLGNSPLLLKMFMRAAKQLKLADDTAVHGERVPANRKKTREQLLFPTSAKKEG